MTASILTCIYMQITSFNDTTLRDKFPPRYQREKRLSYVPIHDAPKHPDTNELLYLEQNYTLAKESYVNLKSGHEFPCSAMYWFGKHLNDDKSYVLESNSVAQLFNLLSAAGEPLAGPSPCKAHCGDERHQHDDGSCSNPNSCPSSNSSVAPQTTAGGVEYYGTVDENGDFFGAQCY